ncbi:glycosyltransferase family 4 protein [Nocardia asteroides NBRC 15531]|uniref:Glycosyltransferase n=1 Tax=Nocardia asteroides NBRC 15531 TaxID=1110697 RepID=U5EJA7_NOCAS|nr:glycosyltransferase [Nocardia asteroides]TLF67008.1 glycosyltransferase family 4 protein [Nocardia asteroides NBRC 15531]UGT51730.1 glycosyltransferase [Nocardia asteroides]SFM18402.1 Glycosyltransferase involved in cell wall bisynthesis [Nocardia asteroides]VEG35361.1 D-inositol-3-phosphate glycosyltransferase [Nocardia asteroides]GAD86481.1 putative glycosyltransferase [Nocardia asteroides NBRC 15531]
MTRIALVHERFTEFGGSEAVVGEFVETWPGAEVFAPIVAPGGVRPPVGAVTDSWLSRAHAALGGRHAPLLPLVPPVLRRLPLRAADVVVISHHAFATQAALATDAPVVAYVHSPARWAWDREFRAQEAGGRAGQLALAALGALARRGELRAAPRLTRVVANSHAVAQRVTDWWGLPATVVNPPVQVDRFTPDPAVPREDFFLCAGRLVPYKRADLAIRAAQRAGTRLVVLGEGRFRAQLEAIAGPETTFLGATSAEQLQDMYRRCRALLMPGIEDFGIVPVEAMACGAPVLAVGVGGALDTVRPGVTGAHVPAGSDAAVVAALAASMNDTDWAAYDPAKIREHALSFAPAVFRARMAGIVEDVLDGR